jgi:hypothetical protein
MFLSSTLHEIPIQPFRCVDGLGSSQSGSIRVVHHLINIEVLCPRNTDICIPIGLPIVSKICLAPTVFRDFLISISLIIVV